MSEQLSGSLWPTMFDSMGERAVYTCRGVSITCRAIVVNDDASFAERELVGVDTRRATVYIDVPAERGGEIVVDYTPITGEYAWTIVEAPVDEKGAWRCECTRSEVREKR